MSIQFPALDPQPDAGFAPTRFMLDESDVGYDGFAPTQLLVLEPCTEPARLPAARRASVEDFPPRSMDTDWAPSAWATARWVQEQEAKAVEVSRRIAAAHMARGALDAAASATRRPPRRGWLMRLEDALDRLLPGNLGTLLQLFICVSLSMALISALLPLVDRI